MFQIPLDSDLRESNDDILQTTNDDSTTKTCIKTIEPESNNKRGSCIFKTVEHECEKTNNLGSNNPACTVTEAG